MSETTNNEKPTEIADPVEELVMRLTPRQSEHYKSIRWLVQNGPRAVGKSYVLAVAFIEEAMANKGTWVRVFDHTRHFEADRYLLSTVRDIFTKNIPNELYQLEIRKHDNSFRIKYA